MMAVQAVPTATVCIATCGRPEALRSTLESWQAATRVPAEIRIADSSTDCRTRQVCEQDWRPLVVSYLRCDTQSAALQRDLAAEQCETDLVIFCDDDVELPPTALEDLLRVFEADTEEKVGGVAATIEGLHHHVPSTWLRRYYRLQAGYAHEHYGGHFFGSAINLLPTDAPGDPLLYRSEWLNSTLVVYRTPLFARHRFPPFRGYSFQEDVSLSWRIGRTHELYFHRGVRYLHKAVPGAHKADPRALATMRMAHRWHNATELLGLAGPERAWKFLLSLAFDGFCLWRDGWADRREYFEASCAALWALAVRREEPLRLVERVCS
jgi:glycosyltransferase involved in cell wall biosynthesis